MSIVVQSAMSQELLIDPPEGFADWIAPKSERATCKTAKDDAMIRSFVHDRGGFDRVDKWLIETRLKALKVAASVFDRPAETKNCFSDARA